MSGNSYLICFLSVHKAGRQESCAAVSINYLTVGIVTALIVTGNDEQRHLAPGTFGSRREYAHFLIRLDHRIRSSDKFNVQSMPWHDDLQSTSRRNGNYVQYYRSRGGANWKDETACTNLVMSRVTLMQRRNIMLHSYKKFSPAQKLLLRLTAE